MIKTYTRHVPIVTFLGTAKVQGPTLLAVRGECQLGEPPDLGIYRQAHCTGEGIENGGKVIWAAEL